MEYVQCVKPGLLTTVQDLGRSHYQHYGISAAGAMDPLSLRIGNILVGNKENTASLEITIMGPELVFMEDTVISITGGDLSPTVNDQPVEMWKSLVVKAGEKLNFGKINIGCRSYIAFAGGIQVPEIMGSSSTFLRGEYGGHDGRALRKGDTLLIGTSPYKTEVLKRRRLPNSYIPDFHSNRPVRIIWGPHDGAFIENSKTMFTNTEYKITSQSDRMGYRLDGQKLIHKESADIISEYIAPGTIQVPANGQPIVLMADCQMSGGYTKIGMVIGADIPYLAQKKPGESITFQAISIQEAQQIWIEQEKWLSVLQLNNSA